MLSSTPAHISIPRREGGSWARELLHLMKKINSPTNHICWWLRHLHQTNNISKQLHPPNDDIGLWKDHLHESFKRNLFLYLKHKETITADHGAGPTYSRYRGRIDSPLLVSDPFLTAWKRPPTRETKLHRLWSQTWIAKAKKKLLESWRSCLCSQNVGRVAQFVVWVVWTICQHCIMIERQLVLDVLTAFHPTLKKSAYPASNIMSTFQAIANGCR